MSLNSSNPSEITESRQVGDYEIAWDGQNFSQIPQGGATQPLPCFLKMGEAAVPERERDITAFRYCVHLRKQGYTQDSAEAMAIMWDENHCSPPLGGKIIKEKIKQAFKSKYGYGCLEPPICQYCDTSCPIYKQLHLAGDGMTPTAEQTKIEVEELLEIKSGPPMWELRLLNKKDVEEGERISINHLKTRHLRNPAYLDMKAFEVLNFSPFLGIKPYDWIKFLDTLEPRGKLIKEEAPIEASEGARILDRIYDWLERAPKAETESDAKAGLPVEKTDGYYFKVPFVEDMLTRRYRLTPERHVLYYLIRSADGHDGASYRLRNSNPGKGWYLPKREVEPEVEPEERETDDKEIGW